MEDNREILKAIKEIGGKIDRLEAKVDKAQTTVNNHTESLGRLEAKVDQVQTTVDNHTESLGRIVRVVAGPMPNAINKLEDALKLPKTDFFAMKPQFD